MPLHSARKAKGLTQEQLESLTGASQSFISKLEHGHCPDAVRLALRLARVLGRSVEDIFGPLVPAEDGVEDPSREAA